MLGGCCTAGNVAVGSLGILPQSLLLWSEQQGLLFNIRAYPVDCGATAVPFRMSWAGKQQLPILEKVLT
jgi:hypothetical protein